MKKGDNSFREGDIYVLDVSTICVISPIVPLQQREVYNQPAGGLLS